MYSFLRKPAVRSGMVAVSMLALCSCTALSQLFAPAPKPVAEQPEPPKKVYDAPAFIYSLSASKLALENGEQLKDISADVKVLEAYSKAKRKKSATLPLVVIDYKQPDVKSTRKLVAYTGEEGEETAALAKLTKRMDGYKAVAQEVNVLNVPVKNLTAMKFAKKDTAQALEMIQSQQDALLAHGTKLSALDEAQIDIALLDFFTQHKNKDAAYLCADSAKRLLAKAVQVPENAQASNELSAELDKLEGQLRKSMPY